MSKDSYGIRRNRTDFMDSTGIATTIFKNIFKGAAAKASICAGPFHDFYEGLLMKGRKPAMARLTLARKIAAITLIIWKKGVSFDAQHFR